MANIIDYIKWRGDLSFEKSPFNHVDNLIFSRLSYIEFDDLENGSERLGPVSKRYVASEEKMNIGILLTENTKPLFEVAGQSQRYESVVLKAFVNLIDEKNEIQFSAVTFELDDDTAYVAFRGTDDTIVGWKEDFNMTFMDVVPAQLEAKKYLERIIDDYQYSKVFVGGHSKGGNLAVYSALHLKDEYKERIVKVYNNDGPGFKNSVLGTSEYKILEERIVTLLPQSSIVGMVLEHEEEYKIVKSSQIGLNQHDAFTWDVLGNDFVYLEKLDADAKAFDIASKKTLEQLSDEQIRSFGNVFFDILAVNDSKTLTDLNDGGLKYFIKMSDNYNKLDKETKKALSDTLSLFFGESYKSYLEVSEIGKIKQKYDAWKKETRLEVEKFFSGIEQSNK